MTLNEIKEIYQNEYYVRMKEFSDDRLEDIAYGMSSMLMALYHIPLSTIVAWENEVDVEMMED